MKLESTQRLRADFLYLAPVCNVLLMLLIYFLLNSTLLVRSGVRVDLPVSSSTLQPLERCHVMTVTADDPVRIFFNEREVFAGDLPTVLADARKETRQVLINADVRAPHGVVQRVQTAIINAGCELFVGHRADVNP
jgi:biopolymer transport protein ExbD